MKILCLVPSITETLIECAANVVGRTRFCIHPAAKIKRIPAVSGTKDIRWDKVKALSPELVIFDREENTLEMAQTCPYPSLALHITSVNNVGEELLKLAAEIDNDRLKDIAQRWKIIAHKPAKRFKHVKCIPATISLLPNSSLQAIKYIDYMIWKTPGWQ